MKCIVELFGDDRNGRKMIAWGRRIGYVDAGRVCDAERRKVAKLFVRAFTLHADLLYFFPPCWGNRLQNSSSLRTRTEAARPRPTSVRSTCLARS